MSLEPESLAAARRAFADSAFPAVLLRGVVDDATLRSIRATLQRAPSERFDRADVGRYEQRRPPRIPGLDALAATAAAIVGRELTTSNARCVRLTHGDYALPRDDDRHRPDMDAWVELVLDVSEASTDQAELSYRSPAGHFVVPQVPGLCAVVGRTPDTGRHQRYLNHRVGERAVLRVTLVLLPAD